MLCYECSLAGNRRDAVGSCHFCSAGLCAEHADVISEELGKSVPIVKTVPLPRKARRLLCTTCRAALEQLDEVLANQHEETGPEARYELLPH